MGLETRCTVRFGRKTSEGKALLETTEVIFRGDFKLVIPLRDVRTVRAANGRLEIAWPDGRAVFELGDAAAKWAAKIANPRTRIDKLGVKRGQRVSVVGVSEPEFTAELNARTAHARFGRIARGSNAIFLGVTALRDLARLGAAVLAMERDGAVWVVWPKGRRALNEDHVRAAAIAAGLVDVKVVAFSPALSALKLVIPVAKR